LQFQSRVHPITMHPVFYLCGTSFRVRSVAVPGHINTRRNGWFAISSQLGEMKSLRPRTDAFRKLRLDFANMPEKPDPEA